MLPCKAKMLYLFTLQVNCVLAMHGRKIQWSVGLTHPPLVRTNFFQPFYYLIKSIFGKSV